MENILEFIRKTGEWLVPLLVSGGVLGWLGTWITNKFKQKKQDSRWNNVIALLENILNKNTCEQEVKINNEEITKVLEELSELKKFIKNDDQMAHDQTATLGQMIGVIFENSTLPAETKERLRTLKTKIEYSSDSKVLEDLIAENTQLKQKTEKLQHDLIETKEKQNVRIIQDPVVADTTNPVQAKNSTIVIQ